MRSSAASSRRREYLTAVRREAAKQGGCEGDRETELVEFECMLLCMSCGHLCEPGTRDPMRTTGEAASEQTKCSMCGTPGLTDLRQTAIVEVLNELESTDAQPSRWARVGKVFGLAGIAAAFAGMLALFAPGLSGSLAEQISAGFLMAPIAAVGTATLIHSASAMQFGNERRKLPRRWRMPQLGKAKAPTTYRNVAGQVETSSELLRAPLTGRPCVAYEVAVRDDADPASSMGSWRLIDQDNVEFRVAGAEVARGEALLQLERELHSEGLIASTTETTRHYMRVRGLIDSEDVCIYETILEPGSSCTLSRRDANEPVRVRS